MPAASRSFQIFAKPAGPACNLSCGYCYYLSKDTCGPARMPEDLLEEYVVQHIAASPDEIVRFSWHGGEPTILGVDYFRTDDRHSTASHAGGTNRRQRDPDERDPVGRRVGALPGSRGVCGRTQLGWPARHARSPPGRPERKPYFRPNDARLRGAETVRSADRHPLRRQLPQRSAAEPRSMVSSRRSKPRT